jgi:Protein of unknown function (DUF3015)
MKKMITVALVCAAAVSGTAGAAENPNLRANVGVGVGTLIFESADADGLVSQISASWTNFTFLNQAFFITTGTGGAKKWDKLVDNRPLRDYLRDNLDLLARDMAAGSGESLTTIAELAGVKEADRPQFFAKIQANYANIFTSADVTSDQVLINIDKTVG